MGSTSSGVAKGPFEGAALEELTKMVRDLHIAWGQRDSAEQPRDRRLPAGQRCILSGNVLNIERISTEEGKYY